MENILNKSINIIKNIGNERSRLFAKLGIFTVEQLLEYFPRDYEDRSSYKTTMNFVNGEECSFKATISGEFRVSRSRRGLTIFTIKAVDETGSINLVWFNQKYIKNSIKNGETYLLFGKTVKKSGWEVINPVFEKVDKQEFKSTGRIIPVYNATNGLTQRIIRETIEVALKQSEGVFKEFLPNYIRLKHELCEINYAINKIHFPQNEDEVEQARKRLVFEELFLFQLGLSTLKNRLDASNKYISFTEPTNIEDFTKNLNFELTSAQKRVYKEISDNMEKDKNMNRLVQGDVGSGKTVVAAIAVFKAAKNGYQTAFMAPTEILTKQHFESLEPLLKAHDINLSILTGSMTKKQKAIVLEGLANGSIDLVLGTHAVLEENVVFKKLGLVITDEQHRFGVRQRAVLASKGQSPDVLVMTATPIPRTLALILYGDLDISIIDELPPGRKPIKTYSVNNSMRERIDSFVRKLVAEGRQVYIVCPLVEESEEIDASSVVEQAERISLEFKELSSGLLYGKMKDKDKNLVMEAFKKGELNILVSTTVIEVGVNVPNATVMIVENAERFGLAQLHQLRGRVGRGAEQSYCILYNESNSKVSKERMKVMEQTNDGFVISEKDLELRGPGEFFGTRQHGIPELKIANLYRDIEILKTVQIEVEELLKKDPLLSHDEHYMLKEEVESRFNRRIEI